MSYDRLCHTLVLLHKVEAAALARLSTTRVLLLIRLGTKLEINALFKAKVKIVLQEAKGSKSSAYKIWFCF